MQQLSLFDFGEEAPKSEQSNKHSKDVSAKKGHQEEIKSVPLSEQVEEYPHLEKNNIISELEKNAQLLTNETENDKTLSPANSKNRPFNNNEDNSTAKTNEEQNISEGTGSMPAEDKIIDTNSSQISEPKNDTPEQSLKKEIAKSTTINNDAELANTHTGVGKIKDNDSIKTAESDTSPKQKPNDIPTNEFKEQYFANEQIGIKIVRKVLNSDSSAERTTGDSESNNNINVQPQESDTSFPPSELYSEDIQESIHKDSPILNKEQKNGPEITSSLDDAAILPERPTSQITPTSSDLKIEASHNSKDLQKIEVTEIKPFTTTKENSDTEEGPNNPHEKIQPFYAEDRPVPIKKRGRRSFKEIDSEVDLIDVPPDEQLFQKQYYPISEVAKWFRVNTSLLRFWENEFKILRPKKNKKGDRFFRPEDVKNLQLIYYLLRQKKLTINGAIKHLKSYKEQTEVNMQLINTLNEFKGFLLELKASTENNF